MPIDATWHHVAISVRDIDREIVFYRDLLGFEVEWDIDHYKGEMLSKVVGMPDADAHIVMLRGYGTRIELFYYYNPRGKETPPKKMCDFGITHFTLSVKDVNLLYERLLNEGVKFNCPPQNLRPGVWATYMNDPEGITIELVKYLE